MSSIVLDLQTEITSQNCDIVNILRRAHVIAVKLGLREFDQWISFELNGYPNQDACPDYRKIRGVLKAFNPYRGWIPTLIPDAEFENAICERKVANSISEIISLCSTAENGLISEFTGEQLAMFNKMFDSPLPMKYALHIPNSMVMDIVEKVKNTVLEWTLRLEAEGVLGEGMKFSAEEKESARALPQTVNNYYGATNVINAPSDGMQIVSGNASVVFSYGEASKAMSDISDAIEKEQISADDKETALELISEINEKIEKQKNPSVIKSLLIGLKDFMINAGGALAAGLIQAKIQGLF